ncbi:hypothetical protein F5Y06DRAFT_305923 [Hypoxylon sp. FL0890]|nr:hypothetical protein F5Y06DRAFT_305923 [Hypoxylon sp. FL0890]
MPKLINSVSYELGLAKCKIDELTSQKRELEAKIVRLEAHIKKHNIPLPRSPSSQVTTKSASLDKNFLKPTAASLNRHTQAPRQKVSENTEIETVIHVENYGRMFYSFKYNGGVLEKIPDHDNNYARFRQETTSSLNKRRSKFSKVEEDEWNTESDDESTLAWKPDSDSMDWYSSGNDWSMEKTEEIEHECPGKAAKESLIQRSRLKEETPKHLEHMPLRSEILIVHLKRALRLAQDIFFYGAKKYHPRAVRELQGPQEIQWRRDEMRFHFFYNIGAGLDIAGNWYRKNDLEYAFDDITRLRNTVCHFGIHDTYCPLSTYDNYMKRVQNLAIIFGDERRAFRARTYRDNLIKEGENSLSEITRWGLFAALPYARPWEIHHVRSFESIINSRWYESDCDEVPHAFLMAVRDWDLRRPKPSDGKWLPESLREWDWPSDTESDELSETESLFSTSPDDEANIETSTLTEDCGHDGDDEAYN